MKPSGGQRSRLILLLAALAATIVACTSDGKPSGARPSPPQSNLTDSSQVAGPDSPTRPSSLIAPSATASSATETAALDAYRKMWAAMVQAAVDPDPANPELAKFATGTALQKLQYSLAVDRENGFTSKGTLHFAPQVTSVGSSSVKIFDCTDDSSWLKYKPDGTLKGDAPGGKRRTEATLTPVDATWKVSDLRVDGVGTCS
ncbi:hypothetical protein OG216_35020 [Streptomycetaceae bacterium NBC_01309]